jgi:hypothetical protein
MIDTVRSNPYYANYGNVRTLTIGGGPGVSLQTPEDLQTIRGYALLTPDDWAAVSATVGYPCGPDEDGNIAGLQPVLAVTLARDRLSGRLDGPLTSGYLANDIPGQEADHAAVLKRAVDFLEAREDRDPDQASRPSSIDVLA